MIERRQICRLDKRRIRNPCESDASSGFLLLWEYYIGETPNSYLNTRSVASLTQLQREENAKRRLPRFSSPPVKQAVANSRADTVLLCEKG